jgi:hypothetical protein
VPPVRGVTRAAQLRACLQSATNPDVPICAAVRMVTVVVLARHPVLERVRLAALTTPDAERSSACRSAGAGGLPRLRVLLRPTGTSRTRIRASSIVETWRYQIRLGPRAQSRSPSELVTWPGMSTSAKSRRGTRTCTDVDLAAADGRRD